MTLKAYAKWTLLIITFAVLLPLSLRYLNLEAHDKSLTQIQVVPNASPGLPVRLTIPAINVNTEIEHVGVNIRGEMDVPSNTADAAWFNLGSRPGEKGSAVISGHFNGKNGSAGVFSNLHKLKTGDKILIHDDKGIATSFIVRESRMYDQGYAEEVFSLNDRPYLNLITCDGVWDEANQRYTKRLVVFTERSEETYKDNTITMGITRE